MLYSIATIQELKRFLLNELSGVFKGNEAYSVTKIILEHVGFTEMTIAKDPNTPVKQQLQDEITKIVTDLKQNKPIQYILGECNFLDLTFFVNEHVLIPRQETEELVSMILIDNTKIRPRIIDIGCGSGCIAVSLAHSLPGSMVFAMDVDPEATAVAGKNAAANKVSIDFLQADILKGKKIFEESFDIIASNPPYVTEGERIYMSPNVLNFEPELALFVPDEDPLKFYHAIIVFADQHLSKDGKVWVEINEHFGEDCKEIFKAAGYESVQLIKDIHEKDRFIKASKNG